MTIEESLQTKEADLRSKITAAQTLIDNPKTSGEEARSAMSEIKNIQADIKNLRTLQEARSESSTSDSESDSTSDSDSESTTSDSDDSSDSSDSSESSEDRNNNIQSEQMEERSMPIKIDKTATTGKTSDVEKRALNDYLHSQGEKRGGLTSTDVGVLIPVDILYNPEAEVKTVTDLGAMVNKQAVNTSSGKYPIMKKPSTTLPSVAELEENPALSKPDFLKVSWDITTYRGAIPLSQESIDDTQVDLTAIIADYVQQIKLNTTNEKIAEKLKSFQAGKAAVATIVDDLKKIVNVDLDVAYDKAFVVTQSAYNLLDTIKDSQGRYLLQDNIASPSGKILFGLFLSVVEDTAFGGEIGATQIWVGDLERAILYASRADVAVQWVRSEIYGKYLQAVVRFDIEVADDKAGYFVELSSAEA